MKRVTLFAVLLLIITISTYAQNIQFTPIAGYTFADKFNFDRGKAKIGDGFTYGGILSYVINDKMAIDISYSREDCDVFAYSDYYDIDIKGQISANYIFLGLEKLMPLNENAFLFTGTNLGVGIYSGKNSDLKSTTKFAVGINGGLKYFFSDRLGFRAQANLNFPITDVGAGLWWGGGGPSVGLTSRIPFLQFGFSGGLIFNLN